MISGEQVDGMWVDRFSYSQRQTPLDSRITPFYLHETACWHDINTGFDWYVCYIPYAYVYEVD